MNFDNDQDPAKRLRAASILSVRQYGHKRAAEEEAKSSSSSCFCTVSTALLVDPQGKNKNDRTRNQQPFERLPTTSDNDLKIYTDQDFFKDMAALTVQEREILSEDIHGITEGGVTKQETKELIHEKIAALKECLEHTLPQTVQRGAWDRARYLRPSLEHDRDHYLKFLRAKQYDVFDAATLLLRYYESQKVLWGDERFLIQRVTWDDLSAESQAMVRRGVVIPLPKNRESGATLLRVNYVRVAEYSMENMTALLHGAFFPEKLMEDNPESQKLGRIYVVDNRGKWKSSGFDFIRFMKVASQHLESTPLHTLAFHTLMDKTDPFMDKFNQAGQALFSKKNRVRMRLHAGSWMELQYSLRTYGIDIPADPLEAHRTPDSLETPFSRASIDAGIRYRQSLDQEWREREAPYQVFTSRTALYPNPHDYIMGRQHSVTASWPGNVAYNRVIKLHAPRYLAETDKQAKTAISIEVLNTIQSGPKAARFLVRKQMCWEVLSERRAQDKVSQSLRDEARMLLKEMRKVVQLLG